MNILVPMAGAGRRLAEAGHDLPKPMVDVGGKPMIQVAVESWGLNGKYIFVVQEEHDDKYDFSGLLSCFVDNFEIVRVSGLTEGAACTALCAESLVDRDEELFVAVCDAYNDLGLDEKDRLGVKRFSAWDDGTVFCFGSQNPRYSYVKEYAGYVTRVAEKECISDKATSGVYYWRSGRDFVRCAKSMIRKGRRVGNEFYLAPVYNEAIEEGARIRARMVRELHDLGTQDSIDRFLSSCQSK